MDRENLPSVVVELNSLRTPNCGLGRFAMHLGQALLDENPRDFRLSFLVPRHGASCFQADSPDLKRARHWYRDQYAAWIPAGIWQRLGGPVGELWHVTNQYSKYWPVSNATPTLLTIHDLNFLREKPSREVPRRIRQLQRQVDRSVAIATISEFSATEIRRHLDLRGKPLRVIYNGLAAPHITDSQPIPSLPSGRFLFTIGDITAKKNFHVLLDLMPALPEYRLVIAGRKQSDYARQIEREVVRRDLAHQVLLPGEVTDAQRQWLYEHCEAFLFPSLTEGFGLPVIEAMSFGKPVFITRGTSLPEVGGELAHYWEDFEPRAMVSGLREGLKRIQRDPDFSNQSRRHAGQFTWTSAAAAYVDYYRDLLSIQKQSQRRVA